MGERLRDRLVERVRAEIDARNLSPEQVARRAGLETPKTVRRLLSGETCSLDTLEAVANALGVDLLDSACPVVGQLRPASANDGHPPQRSEPLPDRPVDGWAQAALVLGIPARTLYRKRARLGAKRADPWWPSVAACRRWWERLCAAPPPRGISTLGRPGGLEALRKAERVANAPEGLPEVREGGMPEGGARGGETVGGEGALEEGGGEGGGEAKEGRVAVGVGTGAGKPPPAPFVTPDATPVVSPPYDKRRKRVAGCCDG